jgi:hypothetical protein
MTEDEILVRAREAAIKADYSSIYDESEVRDGRRDDTWPIVCIIQALRDLSKPLSEIQPVDPDLMEAQAIIGGRVIITSGVPQMIKQIEDIAVAAIKRGRELQESGQ